MWKLLHVKYTLFLWDFKDTSIFTTDFRKTTQISNLIKIRSVGAELFHADGRSGSHDEADSRFRNFSKAPKNLKLVENDATVTLFQ